MGVPGFYRWAVRKVPHMRQNASNPPYEVDNFYLDFNGVIHGCATEWGFQSEAQEDSLFNLIEQQLLILLSIVQPSTLFYIAVDGVAPRAKLNQQRSRRFRAAKEAEIAADMVEGAFDKNAITPGTPFMSRLNARLRAWAEANAALPVLRGVAIVISGDRDPGEGEHKIMEVIRHHPERTHCLFSNDADLVFLALVSPADNVYLLRVKPMWHPGTGAGGSRAAAADPGQHLEAPPTAGDNMDGQAAGNAIDAGVDAGAPVVADDRAGAAAEAAANASADVVADSGTDVAADAAANAGAAAGDEPGGSGHDGKAPTLAGAHASDYELLRIFAIRDWLAGTFPDGDRQRLITDFVAMCCLAGNDFLPHMDAVEIYSGGLDVLMRAYGRLAATRDGYLVSEDLKLVLPRWRLLLESFAQDEAESLLETVGLGLGPQQSQQVNHGPGPPTEKWDGLSVLVTRAPKRATAADVTACFSKQGCTVGAVFAVQSGGPRGAPAWLVRFADPDSAVATLVATRRLFGQVLSIRWVDPASCNLDSPPSEPFAVEDWRPALMRAIRTTFEFWFGSENLPGDTFLRRQVRTYEDRFVPLRVISSFKRLQTWCQDFELIAEALRPSTLLEVRGEGDEVAVRTVEDHSVRPEETPELLAAQHAALKHMGKDEHDAAVQALSHGYYTRKGGPTTSDAPPLDDVDGTARFRSREFLKGIEWVVHYYIRGCSSWSWFYPAHYPPLCTSLALATAEPLDAPILHNPYPPELQLLSVLPPQSLSLLPVELRPLVGDPSSTVADFYPLNFSVDLKEGDKEWQATVLLPFIDESRLVAALRALPWDDSKFSLLEPARAYHARKADADAEAESGQPAVAVRVWDFCVSNELPTCRQRVGPIVWAKGRKAPKEVPEGGRKLCFKFKNGWCEFGASCKFSHAHAGSAEVVP